ncbi:MAG: DUF1572 domain-containing protein [Pyrinomonadaceae bacterium]|nr:DUF1572 domain-containing protein [Pyrinomonadaceae bacterium]
MLKEILIQIYERELNKLKTEINLYTNEANLWLTDKEITNSAGNLTLHLLGNLNHFFGALLAKNGYLRNRPTEFTDKNVPRENLIERIDEAIEIVKSAIANLTEEELASDYPETFQEKIVKTDFFIVHLATHFSYHLGQINYHRRLLD